MMAERSPEIGMHETLIFSKLEQNKKRCMALFLAVDLYEQAAGSESRRRIERKGWSVRRDEANGKRVGAIQGTWKILALSLKILEWKRRPGMFFNEPCRLGLGTLRSNTILLSTHCPILSF